MSNGIDFDRDREVLAKIREMPAADWVREMIAYHRRTGTYRVKDLRRLLGDPMRRVDVSPEGNAVDLALPSNRE